MKILKNGDSIVNQTNKWFLHQQNLKWGACSPPPAGILWQDRNLYPPELISIFDWIWRKLIASAVVCCHTNTHIHHTHTNDTSWPGWQGKRSRMVIFRLVLPTRPPTIHPPRGLPSSRRERKLASCQQQKPPSQTRCHSWITICQWGRGERRGKALKVAVILKLGSKSFYFSLVEFNVNWNDVEYKVKLQN